MERGKACRGQSCPSLFLRLCYTRAFGLRGAAVVFLMQYFSLITLSWVLLVTVKSILTT